MVIELNRIVPESSLCFSLMYAHESWGITGDAWVTRYCVRVLVGVLVASAEVSFVFSFVPRFISGTFGVNFISFEIQYSVVVSVLCQSLQKQ